MEALVNWTELFTPFDTLIDCIRVERNLTNANNFLCGLSKVFGTLLAYIFPFIGTFNFINNSIVAAVFLIPLRRENRYYIFLGILAIADIGINFFIGWLWLFPSFGVPFATSGSVYYFILTRSVESCRLLTFLQTFWCNLRGIVYIILAFDRLLLMYQPLGQKIPSKYLTIILLIIAFTTSIAISIPIGIYYGFKKVRNFFSCWYIDYGRFLSFYQVLLSNSCLFHLAIVSLFDILLLVKIIRWSRSRHKMTDKASTLNMKQISPTITLLVLNAVSFVSSLPSGVTYMILVCMTDASLEFARSITFLIYLSLILMMLQSAFNILLYYVRMEKFRQVLLKSFLCHCIHTRLSSSIRSSTVSTNL
ncbi:rhodopsin-like orphan GPCR [Schistosoma japonicum]|uniref:Rhodopsin-like orphan GPCR n=1 Tax=Schistosoma japonicum TaxID=6182 RepID=A0A4Z2CZH7_SCHJA|nr:rhodopsin-like orphan GPCR [Schistosoma japonicum]